ncbi:iron-containing alcohol dehydrogenase [Desulfosarcina ovata]|nr:iron-containing alcohol dehydrogenase [Desulfosarcina ovata]
MTVNDAFNFNHKTRICFGPGVIGSIGGETKKYGDRVLIVCDSGVKQAGIVAKVTSRLDQAGLKYSLFDEVMPNPRDTGCIEAAETGTAFGANVLIGIGGGSAMDTAKAANVLMTNGGDLQTWSEIRKFKNSVLPLICVPTTSGTGSEVTFEAVITNTKTHQKISISDGSVLAPELAIMDPELTLTVPPIVTASTGMDALTHALEAYTCKYSHPLSDGLAVYAMRKIAHSIETAVREGTDLKARSDMMVGSLMAGMAFTNSYVGSVHSIAEVIGGYYDTPHGIANSIFLPIVTRYNMVADPKKHAVVARCLGIETQNMSDIEASQKGVEKIFKLNDVLGIPKFKDVDGVNLENFDTIAADCVKHNCTKANARDIGYEEYLILLKKAYDNERR